MRTILRGDRKILCLGMSFSSAAGMGRITALSIHCSHSFLSEISNFAASSLLKVESLGIKLLAALLELQKQNFCNQPVAGILYPDLFKDLSLFLGEHHLKQTLSPSIYVRTNCSFWVFSGGLLANMVIPRHQKDAFLLGLAFTSFWLSSTPLGPCQSTP